MLRIAYRYFPFDNSIASRPKWFSKLLCLASFYESLRALLLSDAFVLIGQNIELLFFIDHNSFISVNEESIFNSAVYDYNATVIFLNIHSNCGSYRRAYEDILNRANEKDVILFVEDDYLWLKCSLIELISAISELPECDYLTPYDHPVRYDPNYSGGPDISHWETKIYLAHQRHYRTHESTCMTFFTKGNILKEDKVAHFRFCALDNKSPNDRELFRFLQHLGDYSDTLDPPRLLLGPIPSLATHVHLPYLAPCIDWETFAKQVRLKWQTIIPV